MALQHDASPALVLLFEYRSAVETVDLDAANEESWRDALASFGYQKLDTRTFMQDLALSSSSEVMMALCPYTTKNEWGPTLSRRDSRLAAAVGDMCYANVVPVPGIVDLISNASKLRRTTTIFLSPFDEDVTRTLLTLSGIDAVIDCVVCYSSLDAAVLEALRAVHCAPPQAMSPHERTEPTPSGMSSPPADIVTFVSTSTAVRKMRRYGITLVGIMHNNCDQEADHDDDESDLDPLPGRDDSVALLDAGCRMCVMNYKHIMPSHLALLRSDQSPSHS